MIRHLPEIATAACLAALVWLQTQERGIHLVFSSLLSLLFIAALVLTGIAWMAYISMSQRSMKRQLTTLVTKQDLDRELQTFKEEVLKNIK